MNSAMVGFATLWPSSLVAPELRKANPARPIPDLINLGLELPSYASSFESLPWYICQVLLAIREGPLASKLQVDKVLRWALRQHPRGPWWTPCRGCGAWERNGCTPRSRMRVFSSDERPCREIQPYDSGHLTYSSYSLPFAFLICRRNGCTVHHETGRE